MCRVSLDYRRFYALGERFARGTFRVHSLGELPGGDPLALTRGEVELREPIRFAHDEGSRIKDHIGTTKALLHLVSDRFISALDGFSGWRTYPVEVYDADGELIVGYHGLAVTGRSGPIDDELSPVMVLPPPVPRGAAMPHRIGIRFWPETWDGSDVFMPEERGWVLVTQAVRDALSDAKITGIELHRITEIELLLSD
jgi:hypothetical protein